MSLAWYKSFALLFLVLYASVGLFSRFTTRGVEDAYPFFSWFLFSEVPRRVQADFGIIIVRAGEEEFSEALLLESDPSSVYDVAKTPSTELQRLTQQLGSSIAVGDKAEAERLRVLLERGFTVSPVTYRVVRATFNPVDRWKEGKVLSSESLAEFVYAVQP